MQFTFYLDKEDSDKLRAIAAAKNTTAYQLAKRAVRRWLSSVELPTEKSGEQAKVQQPPQLENNPEVNGGQGGEKIEQAAVASSTDEELERRLADLQDGCSPETLGLAELR